MSGGASAAAASTPVGSAGVNHEMDNRQSSETELRADLGDPCWRDRGRVQVARAEHRRPSQRATPRFFARSVRSFAVSTDSGTVDDTALPQSWAPLSTPPSIGRILVVDDVGGNVSLITALLCRDGYLVSSATNGHDALKAVARDHPDLVLMDVRMPGLDGFDACEALKTNPATRLIPVVLMTAQQDTEDRIRGIEAGADDFITKPFNAHELRARIRSLVRIKRYMDELETAES